MRIKEFIKKLQGLPEEQRMTIMWAVVGIIAIIFFIFWFDSAKKNLGKADFSNALAPFSAPANNANLGDQLNQIKEQGQKILDQTGQLEQE